MNYWLMKTEPRVFSIEDLEKEKQSPWEGVRNYQARNYMKTMSIQDLAFIYHSSDHTIGIAGLASVVSTAYPDDTAFDPQSPYHDPRSCLNNPIWVRVDVGFLKKYQPILTLSEMKSYPELSTMMVLKKGCRLSIQPVSHEEFKFLNTLLSHRNHQNT